MSKEDLKKQIELLVRDDESNQQTIIKQSEEIERLNNIINEVSKELKEFNESYLEDEGDTGVYRYLNKLIEKLNEGE